MKIFLALFRVSTISSFSIVGKEFSTTQNFELKCAFRMKTFNMFKKHFKNFGNYTWQWLNATIFGCNNESSFTGADIEIFKKGHFYIGHHSCTTKKILGSSWSKKAKIALETRRFWWNISNSIFKFSPFLYTIETCRWNLTNFSKFTNTLIRKEKKHSNSTKGEKKNWEKLDVIL